MNTAAINATLLTNLMYNIVNRILSNMVLTKKQRSKIAKQNRAKGYRVEYDNVWYHRNQNIFAFRIPSRQQKGELSTLDVVVCTNPVQFHQCKYRHDLMKKEEVERHKSLCKKYDVLPILCWRDRGLKFEPIL